MMKQDIKITDASLQSVKGCEKYIIGSKVGQKCKKLT